MPSTHVFLHYHLVFSTKNREPWLPPTERHRVHEYLGGIVRHINGVPHAVGGTGDHVHLSVGLKAPHCLADIMREIKSESSRWIRQELRLAGFTWQEGYGAFTFAAKDLEPVRAYVLNQEEHHRTKTFQEEYVELLRRGMVEYDDRYLW
jgi:REP element-mobilizing transposase RayT